MPNAAASSVALPSPSRSWRSTAGVAPRLALAQAWPEKPIRIVVGFPPGGAADQIARLVGQPLQDALGQPVVIENRTGAGGNVAGDAVAKSAPDGYTLLHELGRHGLGEPAHLPEDELRPRQGPDAGGRGSAGLGLPRGEAGVPGEERPGVPRLREANPGKLSYGSPGNGSSPHLAVEMMNSQAGVSTRHIPYRGAAPALQDLLGGQIDFLMDPGIGLPQVQAGKLKLLAVGGLHRSPLYPDVPTLDESGLKGFDADSLFGFYAPAARPRP